MNKLDKLVIGTRNPGKVAYYQGVLKNLVDKVLGLDEVGLVGRPEERGESAEENVRIKALYYSTQTKLPIFCEDEALYVDFLPNHMQPGVHVRRINGNDEASDEQLLQYWEKLIKRVPRKHRTGRWHIAYSLALNNRILTVSRDCPITFYYPVSAVRIPGWPMSSLEGDAYLGKPHSERTPQEVSNAQHKDSKLLTKIVKDLLNQK